MRAYICFWFEYQEKPLSEIWYPMEYFIERRLRESTKMRLSANIKKGGKGRKSIILCLDGQSALPDLLYDVLYLNDRTRTDDLQKILFEKSTTRSREVSADNGA